MILSPDHVIRLALDAGFPPDQAIIATAIAHAESGFNDQAIGDVALEDNRWGPSVGLWQIRTLKHPAASIRDKDWLLEDPANQAKAAYMISGAGRSFQPWSTFTNGAYLQYIAEATIAAHEIGGLMASPTTTIVSFSPSPTGKGYWIVFSDGAIFAFGDAEYHGRPQADSAGVWQVAQ